MAARSPLLARLAELAGSTRVALLDDRGTTTHDQLIRRARSVAGALLNGAPSLDGRRVALLLTQDADWLAAFLGVLIAGGVVVPLAPAYPAAELAWFAADAEADLVLLSAEYDALALDLAHGRRVLRVDALLCAAPAPLEPTLRAPDDLALLLYTSGTTGRPKGAMLTHANLATHARLLGTAWGFTERDQLLHTLPLHHLHGLGIALLTAYLAGAATRMLPRFDPERVTRSLAHATVFMAVPTIYRRLADAADPARLAAGARTLRLATSGSAALPIPLGEWWRSLAGDYPLERFGMTEVGVALSNPLEPSGRQPGRVGTPLPTVELRCADDGELYVRGPSVFAGYWRRPDTTPFEDGWFRTGDLAETDAAGSVRLLGRTSVDILKSGGYKLSALEIEAALAEHPALAEVAVVGLPDATWGDLVVCAFIVRAGSSAPDHDSLRAFARARLAAYQVPREFVALAELPRNPLGKVVKPRLVELLRART